MENPASRKIIDDLYEKLKQNQGEKLVLQSATLSQQVKKAVKHLEGLKKQQTSPTQDQQQGWWARQKKGVKATIIGSIIALIILIAVAVNQMMKAKKDAPRADNE